MATKIRSDQLGKPITGVSRDVPAKNSIYRPESSYLGDGYWKGANFNANSQYENVNQFQMGEGKTAIKMSKQGQWFGGNKFDEARIKISPEGNMIFKDSAGFDRILIGEIDI